MAGAADDEQVHVEVGSQLENVPHRMPDNDMRLEHNLPLVRHGAGALKDGVESPRCGFGLLPHLLDELWHVVDLLDADHVELATAFFHDPERQRERPKSMIRAVIGMQDSCEHWPLLSFGSRRSPPIRWRSTALFRLRLRL